MTHITQPDGQLRQHLPEGKPIKSLPDWQPADTLPDWGVGNILADGTLSSNITRAMGLVPVRAHQATSVVGQEPSIHDEFVVTHLISNKHQGATAKTSGGQQINDHRGNTSIVREHSHKWQGHSEDRRGTDIRDNRNDDHI